MEEKLTIRVNVADRYYPLKVDRLDEEKIRKAARMINEKVLQYKQRYADKDSQDFLAMAALQYVVKLIDSERNADISPIMEDIQELNKELDDYLNRE